MRAWILILCAAALLSSSAAIAQESAADAGARAYRDGDWESAESLWLAALEEAEATAERGRLCFNLGNAAYRRGQVLHAVGWYTAAQRYLPRDAELWGNLELARSEASLPPADDGGLAATWQRLLHLFTPEEERWIALGTLALLMLCLLGEALRGGPWRMAAIGAAALALLAALRLGYHATRAGEAPLLIVQEGGAVARAEPRPEAKRLFAIASGDTVGFLDELPGWVCVEAREGQRVWLPERAVFDLRR